MATYNHKYILDCNSSFWDRSVIAYIQERGLASEQGVYIDVPYNDPYVLKITAPDETLEAPIRGTKLTVKLMSDTDQQFLIIFTSDSRRFRVRQYWKNDIYWCGWIVPELYSEPHKPIEYSVSIPATDGIGMLKNVEWKDSEGENYSGKKEIFQVILDILALTDLELDVYESCYLYETNLDSTDDDSPLTQLYFDAEVMIDDDKPKSCYEVLEILLRRFHLVLRQWDEAFHVIQINAQIASYVRRKYNYDGTFVSSGSFDPVIDITDSSEPDATYCGYVDEWPTNTVLPAWKKLILTQDYGLDDNILTEIFYYMGDWSATSNGRRGVEPVNPGDEFSGYTNGVLDLRYWSQSDGSRWIESSLGDIEASNTQYLDIDIVQEFKYQTIQLVLQIITDAGETYYLDSDGKWNAGYRTFYSSSDQTVECKLQSDRIAYTGSIFMRYIIYNPTTTLNSPVRNGVYPYWKVNIKESKVLIKPKEIEAWPEEVEITTTIDDNNNQVENYDTIVGDLPDYDLSLIHI